MRRAAAPGVPPPSQVKLPWLNRRLVLEPDRGRTRELVLAVSLAGAMLVPLLLYVRQGSEWLRAGYRIEDLKNQREKLMEIRRRLTLEKASLENLGRVEQVAAAQLGLAQPPAGTVVLVDTSLVKPGPRRLDRESGIDVHDHRSN